MITSLEINAPTSPDQVYISDETERSTIECPAGKSTRDQATYPACICRVDNSLVSSKTSPNGYKKWCSSSGDYKLCPVWRMVRERELKAKGYNDEQYRY